MKFKDMNKKQLTKKMTELSVDMDNLTDELNDQKALLNKVCDMAEFDSDLAIFTPEQLKELGVNKPEAVDIVSNKIEELKKEVKKINGMIKAVEYYLNGGQ